MKNEHTKQAPEFLEYARMISEKSPMQKKRVEAFLAERDVAFWQLAEEFATTLNKYIEAESVPRAYVVDAYLEMCGNMLREQIKFARTGGYTCMSWDEAREKVYGDTTVMNSYMHGLILSQFFWKNHFLTFNFFLEKCLAGPEPATCIEIGVGHGLFSSFAARRFPSARFTAVDASETSIAMARKVFSHFAPGVDAEFTNRDVRGFSPEEKFDIVILGEVIEHLDDPLPVLAAARSLLADGGRMFLSTCANCPAIDHVYNFASVEEISDMLTGAGFRIDAEIALPVEDIPREKWAETKIGINYAARLSRG